MQKIWRSLKSITFGALSLSALPVMALDAVSPSAVDPVRYGTRFAAAMTISQVLPKLAPSAATSNYQYQPPRLIWSTVSLVPAETFDPSQTDHDFGGVHYQTAGFWRTQQSNKQQLQGFQVHMMGRAIHSVDIISSDLAALQANPTKKQRLFVKEGVPKGDGSLEQPFALMSDALAIAKDQDTIYILNS